MTLQPSWRDNMTPMSAERVREEIHPGCDTLVGNKKGLIREKSTISGFFVFHLKLQVHNHWMGCPVTELAKRVLPELSPQANSLKTCLHIKCFSFFREGRLTSASHLNQVIKNAGTLRNFRTDPEPMNDSGGSHPEGNSKTL